MAPSRNVLSEGAIATSGTPMPMKKKEKIKKVSFTLGGLASSSSHFDNIDLLNETHIQALLPSTPVAVAMATPRDIGECLLGYNDNVMYGYDNKYDGLDCYHGAYALGGDSDKQFARHHWMIDSGCTDHLSPFKDDFAHLGNQVHHAIVANGQKVPMYGLGKIIIQSKDKRAEPLVLSKVWYAPHAAHRLMSVLTLTSQGYRCTINDCESNIWDANERLVIQAKALSLDNNLHWFQSNQITPVDSSINSLAKEDSYDLWHHCLGHPSKNALHAAPSHVTGMPSVALLDTDTPCKGCALGKMHDRPYLPSGKCATRPLGLVHLDLVGLMPTESRSRACYVLTFIDDYSGFALVAFLRTKDAVSQHFKSMVSWAETFTGHLLTSVCSDQGGEFMAGTLQSFFQSRGITHQTLVPHIPQQNGRAERFNRTLLEKAEAIRQHACLPRSFWQDAVETALHIYNRQPMRCHEWKTPIEQFNGDKPDVSYFRIFGSLAYVFISLEQRQDKLSPKSEEMIFIGYEPNTKGYHFWSKDRRRVFISTNTIFDEKVFPYSSRDKEDGPAPIPVEEEDPIDNLTKDVTRQRDPEPS